MKKHATHLRWKRNDEHARAAAEMFRKPLQQVTASERQLAKNLRFALMYGYVGKVGKL